MNCSIHFIIYIWAWFYLWFIYYILVFTRINCSISTFFWTVSPWIIPLIAIFMLFISFSSLFSYLLSIFSYENSFKLLSIYNNLNFDFLTKLVAIFVLFIGYVFEFVKLFEFYFFISLKYFILFNFGYFGPLIFILSLIILFANNNRILTLNDLF